MFKLFNIVTRLLDFFYNIEIQMIRRNIIFNIYHASAKNCIRILFIVNQCKQTLYD